MDMTSRPPREGPETPADDMPAEARLDLDESADRDEDAAPILDVALVEEIATPASVDRGVEVIRAHLAKAPMGPGVYRMIGGDGEVLYVGKARSIKKRIASYARGEGHSNRIARMISLTASMIFVSTRTETEALLLEANYIKQMKPRFNVLLRDDKSFPYILLTGDHVSPQLTKHRGARGRKGDYFGPFANVGAVNRTLAALQRAFLVRTCSDSYYENRTRPCLLWQIKRCAGPCTGEINHGEYAALVAEARDFLTGKSRAVRDRLATDMGIAAENLAFERAARLRDRISALSAIQGQQGINPKNVEEADVFAICEEAGQFAIEVFFFRAHQNWGNRAYYPRADRSMAPGEVLDAFLAQFYSDKPPPRLVLLSHEIEDRALMEAALSARADRKVEVAVPQRGERRELVEHAAQNGRETLSRRLAEVASQEKLLAALGQALGLEKTPRRVEVYDNSHIMGTNAIGAMVVAGPQGFTKAHYRTYNIKSTELTPGDDFGMMREVLRRRFARLMKEEGEAAPSLTDEAAPLSKGATAPEALMLRSEQSSRLEARGRGDGVEEEISSSFETRPPGAPQDEEISQPTLVADPDAFPSKPDLVLIDGGRGQFEAARAIFAELNVQGVALASIAKGVDRDAGRETFFVAGREPFRLPPRDPALYFAQRLRDEAHRARRKKDFVKSPLDDIPGIGPSRKRALLNAFGTAKAISRAGLEDLAKTPGLNAATAKLVYDYFREGG
jgi:excinuclease ABC subunit C